MRSRAAALMRQRFTDSKSSKCLASPRGLQSHSSGGQNRRTDLFLDVFEMRTPLAESTWRNTHPNLTSPAEMILSGAVLGDLRDFEAMKIGKQLYKLGFPGSAACEERIGTQWQLDLFADFKASIEGVRHEADTDTCVAKNRGQHGVKTSLRTRDADDFPWICTFSHAQRQRQSSSAESGVPVSQTVGGGCLYVYTYIYIYIYLYVLGPVGGRHR